MTTCECSNAHERRRIVLTGGPGAGKTALLELIRQSFCAHVRVLPEAASIVFGGGFPRHDDRECQRAAQRAIYHVQRQLEITGDSHNPAIVLCDRGTLDGLAYWPGPAEDYWGALGTSRDVERARYDAVIHLRTPTAELGYNHQNPLRTESAARAAEVDALILQAWDGHPRRWLIESSADFLDKAARALDVLRGELPECCRGHEVPSVRDRAHQHLSSKQPRDREEW
jgi:predicted ATPase